MQRRQGRRGAALLLVACAALLGTCRANEADEEELTVHVIAHSHCDPGWLMSFEEYYNRDVSHILNSVVEELSADPEKRFVWSEISFFMKWYENSPPERKAAFRRLVEAGQIEFVGSGWVQHDEANPGIDSVVRQVTEGHEYVQSLFGKRPRIAWQIDPFGHSSATPALFARMGYEAMVINRIHFDAKSKLKAARGMEFVWRAPEHAGGPAPSQDRAGSLDMFTHVLHTHYSAPKGFDFENPGVPMITEHNVENRAARFANEMRGRAAAYRTSHLLVPFGDDFKFKQAKRQFSSMDRLVRHINSNPHYNLRVRYSTLSDYFDSAAAEARDRRVQFPAYTGDYFPYADNRDSYWSGYYSTRPAIKEASRGSEAWLRSGELALALARALPAAAGAKPQGLDWPAAHRSLENARLESALLLHHDAITGTARQRVYRDYLERTQRAREGLEPHVGTALSRLLTRNGPLPAASSGDVAANDAAFHRALEAAAARARLAPSELRVADWLRPAGEAGPGVRMRQLLGAGPALRGGGSPGRAASDVALEMARGGAAATEEMAEGNGAAQPPPVAVGATRLAQARDPRFQQPVAVHNTLAWHRSEVVCLPVDGALPHTRARFATVHDAAGTALPAQVVRRVASRAALSFSGTQYSTEAELCWVAPLRPLAVETFFVHVPSTAFSREERVPAAQQAAAPVTYVYRVEDGVSRPVHSPGMRGAGADAEGINSEGSLHDDVTLANDAIEAVVDRTTGLLTSLRHKATGTRVHVGQDMAQYATTRSGAYLFRPRGDPSSLAAKDKPLLLAVSHGPVVSSVHAQWDSFELDVRLTAGAEHVELSFLVRAENNREVVTRFATSVPGGGKMWTDNGLWLETRSLKEGVPMSANYYPLHSAAAVCSRNPLGASCGAAAEDGGLGLLITSSQSLGVGLAADGDRASEVEVMLHRNPVQDDGRGLAEGVNDHSTARIPLWLSPGVADQVPSVETPPRPHDAGPAAASPGQPPTGVGVGLQAPRLALSWRHLALRQRHPPVVLSLSVPAAEEATGAALTTRDDWLSHFAPAFAPLPSAFPDSAHLMTLAPREGAGDDVVLRVNKFASHGDGEEAPRLPPWLLGRGASEYPALRLLGLRRTLLSLLPVAKRTLTPGLALADIGPAVTAGTPGEDEGAEDGERQNTEEEGVFISDSALENEEGKASGSTVDPLRPRRRRLLAARAGGDASNTVHLARGGIHTFLCRLALPVPERADRGRPSSLLARIRRRGGGERRGGAGRAAAVGEEDSGHVEVATDESEGEAVREDEHGKQESEEAAEVAERAERERALAGEPDTEADTAPGGDHGAGVAAVDGGGGGDGDGAVETVGSVAGSTDQGEVAAAAEASPDSADADAELDKGAAVSPMRPMPGAGSGAPAASPPRAARSGLPEPAGGPGFGAGLAAGIVLAAGGYGVSLVLCKRSHKRRRREKQRLAKVV